MWVDAVLVDASQRRQVPRRSRACATPAGPPRGHPQALRRGARRCAASTSHVDAGEVLAICGDNGAGKSSLIRVVSGAHEPDEGTIEIDGRAVRFGSPQDALRGGRGDDLPGPGARAAPAHLAEHLHRRGADALAAARRAHARQEADARGVARAISRGSTSTIDDTDRAVETLSGGQRQAVAIARALRWNARLVIMDEPTAALGVAESRQVLDLDPRARARRNDGHPRQSQHGGGGRRSRPASRSSRAAARSRTARPTGSPPTISRTS